MNRDKKVIIELRKRIASDASGSLFIRVSVGGKKPYERESLGYVVPEKLWDNEEQRIKKGFPNYEQINRQIQARWEVVSEQITTLIKSGRPLTNEAAVKVLGGGDGDIIAYWQDYMKYLDTPRKVKGGEIKKFSPNYIRKLNSELNRLIEFTKGSCNFSAIDRAWLERYEMYCLPTLDAQTSLPVTFSKLHTVLVRAEDDGLFSFRQVKGFLWPVYQNPDRPYLTLEQTEMIGNMIYSGDLNGDIPLKSCAAYFLIECYCGIRFSDWGKFIVEKLVTKDAIKVRAKKNGQPIYFPLNNSPRLKRAVDLVQSEQLPPPETNQHANRLLKTISTLLDTQLEKIKEAPLKFEITTHVGRHTAATLLLEIGYSEAAVSEILGVSIRTVAIYAKITRRKIDNEYGRLGGI